MSQKNKGLVMQTTVKGYITVLTPQGEFLEIPWTKKTLPDVGSEVDFVNPAMRKGILQKRYFIGLAASIVLLFLFIPVLYGMYFPEAQTVVAYVNIDINPSVELGINKKEKVIEAVGLNEDGKKLLYNLQLINIPVQEALEILTNAAIEENYLAPDKGNNVLITVSTDEKLPSKTADLENEVKRILAENSIPAEASIIEVPAEVHQKAKEVNISTGKYAIYMEALEEGLDVSLDDMRDESIIKVVKDAGGNPGQLISKVKKDKNRIREIEQKQNVIDDSEDNLQKNVNKDSEIENNGTINGKNENGLNEGKQERKAKKEEVENQEKQDEKNMVQ